MSQKILCLRQRDLSFWQFEIIFILKYRKSLWLEYNTLEQKYFFIPKLCISKKIWFSCNVERFDLRINKTYCYQCLLQSLSYKTVYVTINKQTLIWKSNGYDKNSKISLVILGTDLFFKMSYVWSKTQYQVVNIKYSTNRGNK